MNNNYEVIIYWSKEDDSFIAEIPELKGCMADGKTQIDALLNAQSAIDSWIETARQLNRFIPEAKGKLMFA